MDQLEMSALMRMLVLLLLALPFAAYGSKWTYSSEVDGFTDIETHMAQSGATNGDGFVVARCADQSFDLYFSVDEFIGTDGSFEVRYRVDKEPPKSSRWLASTDGTAIFAQGVEGSRLARSMISGTALLLEVTDYRGTPHRTSFSLEGAGPSVQKVLEACAIPLVEYRADTSGISSAVVDYLDLLGPKSIACQKRYLSLLGYDVIDLSSNKTRDLYEQLDKYYLQKQMECSTAEASSKTYCLVETTTFMELYSEAKLRDTALSSTCGSLHIGE